MYSAELFAKSGTVISKKSLCLEKYIPAEYWIGLKQVNAKWQWMNTAAVDYKTWSKYNVTNDVFGVQKCIFVNATGGWSRADCEQKFNFLCKFERMPLCEHWHFSCSFANAFHCF